MTVPVITEAISKGILVDLGAKCGPTFFPSQGRPRRLDAILATRAATVALALRTAWAYPACGRITVVVF